MRRTSERPRAPTGLMKFASLVVACLLGPGAAVAEPTSLVSRFMSEPLSLFDFGMFRIDRIAHEAAKEMGATTGGARYDFKLNRIEIYVAYLSSAAAKLCVGSTDCEEPCRKQLKKLGERFYFKFPDGKFLDLMSPVFTHRDYSKDNFYRGMTDQKAAEELVLITTVEATVYPPEGKDFSCSRALSGEAVSITR